MITEDSKVTLSAAVREKIDKWMLRFPADQKRSALLAALHFAQEDNDGWLSEPVMDAVAEYMDLPKIAVYEVATFYTMYNLEPTGKHVINVCTNVSCMLADSKKIVDHLKNRLQVEINGTSADGKFTLREVECLAACYAAPMFHIGKKYYEYLTPEKVDEILNELE